MYISKEKNADLSPSYPEKLIQDATRVGYKAANLGFLEAITTEFNEEQKAASEGICFKKL